MKTLKSKTIIYDGACPLCNVYTNVFVKTGALEKNGRISFEELDNKTLSQLDPRRSRHEIPLLDTNTGEVLYGLDGLMLVIANMFPFLNPVITKNWFKKILTPAYKFISYNRRVISGSYYGGIGFNSAPDFNLGWRLALIVLGIGYTALGIYTFGLITAIGSILMLFVAVFLYFLLLLTTNLICNKTFEEKVDYLGHLATLGVIESSMFVFTALLARYTAMPALLFAGQGAGRLFAIRLHAKRVENNHYSHYMNYSFAIGAIALIFYLAKVLQ